MRFHIKMLQKLRGLAKCIFYLDYSLDSRKRFPKRSLDRLSHYLHGHQNVLVLIAQTLKTLDLAGKPRSKTILDFISLKLGPFPLPRTYLALNPLKETVPTRSWKKPRQITLKKIATIATLRCRLIDER